MKIREIIVESSATSNENLIQVLLYLKQRSEDNAETATLRTNSIIQLVRNAGDVMFNYRALTDAYESDPAIKNLVKTFNAETVTLKSDSDDTEEDFSSDDDDAANIPPEETVNTMAKSAANKRSV